MHVRKSFLLEFAAAFLVVVVGAPQASAQPDMTRTAMIHEDDGFMNVCVAPCFSVEKTASVWLAGNPTAPVACGAGENLFVYTLEHIGGNLPSPNIPVTEFEVTVDFTLVTGAGFIPGLSTTVS